MVVAAPVTPRLRHSAAQSGGEIQHSNDRRHWTEILAVVTLVPVMVMAHIFPVPLFHEVRKVQTLVMKCEKSKMSLLSTDI